MRQANTKETTVSTFGTTLIFVSILAVPMLIWTAQLSFLVETGRIKL